jgi:hypothetical protein
MCQRIDGLIALTLAAVLSSPGQAVAARGPRAATVTQCLPDETVLYSGRFARAVGSVCLAGDRVHYRYGPPGHPAIDIVNTDDWSNVHFGRVRGGGGGYQNHVRFTVGAENYVIFEGAPGNLTDSPGRRWSGIYVGLNDREGTSLGPHGRPVVAQGWVDILREHAPRSRIEDGSMEEVQDGPWDAWF